MQAFYVVEDSEGILVVQATATKVKYRGLPRATFDEAWEAAEKLAGPSAVYTTLPDGIRLPLDATRPRACWLVH